MKTDRTSWGQTLFCDDVRYELGGKMSLIGLYQTELVVSAEFPIVMPRLVAFVTYYEIYGSMSEILKLNIYMPHDAKTPSFASEILRPTWDEKPPPLSDPDAEPIIQIQAPVVFSPLELQSEGAIKVRMQCGDRVTRLGTINVRRAREEEFKLFSGAHLKPPS